MKRTNRTKFQDFGQETDKTVKYLKTNLDPKYQTKAKVFEETTKI